MKKSAVMTIRMEGPLKKKVQEMATKERRSLADQAAYLIEKGLDAVEVAESEKTTKPAA
jgi:predicted transcriptional regulator